MAKLSAGGRAWLKGLHLLFAGLWIGGALSLIMLELLLPAAGGGDELYAMHLCIRMVAVWIVIPTALGSLLTGALFCGLTNWGFFRYRWIVYKWIVTLAAAIFGVVWLGPWISSLLAIVGQGREIAREAPDYDRLVQLVFYFGSLQALVLIATLFVSTYKPWGRRLPAKP
jgi:hypothetical protein